MLFCGVIDFHKITSDALEENHINHSLVIIIIFLQGLGSAQRPPKECVDNDICPYAEVWTLASRPKLMPEEKQVNICFVKPYCFYITYFGVL